MRPYQSMWDPRNLDSSEAEDLTVSAVEPLTASLREQLIEPYLGHDLERVAAVYRRSRQLDGRMQLLAPANNPNFHPDASAADTIVLILEQAGVDVGCIASRIINCDGSVGEAMEHGRFFYGRSPVPEDHKCIVTAQRAWEVEDRPILYSASIYLATLVTHGTTLAAMLRLHNLWAVTHKFWSESMGLVVPSLERRHAVDVYGVDDLGHWVFRTDPGDADITKYALLSTSRKRARTLWTHGIADLTRPFGAMKSEVAVPKWARNR